MREDLSDPCCSSMRIRREFRGGEKTSFKGRGEAAILVSLWSSRREEEEV